MTQEEIIDALSGMTVLQIAELVVGRLRRRSRRRRRRRRRRPRRRGEDRVRRHPRRRRWQQDRRHQGGPHHHRARPQGCQGPRRGCPQARQAGRRQGRGRQDQGGPREGRRQGRDQVRIPRRTRPKAAPHGAAFSFPSKAGRWPRRDARAHGVRRGPSAPRFFPLRGGAGDGILSPRRGLNPLSLRQRKRDVRGNLGTFDGSSVWRSRRVRACPLSVFIHRAS